MKDDVMNATKVLMDEHRVIERVLTALETAVERLEKGDPVAPSFFLRAADFIKGFADGCHHHKEEDILFPAMREAGIPSEGGPVGVMLEEHAEARQLTAAMRAGAERMESGEADAHEDVARSALGYVALLRIHIAKEDQGFFPMADDAIQGRAREEIGEAFERVEREEVDQGIHERYLALAASLEREASL